MTSLIEIEKRFGFDKTVVGLAVMFFIPAPLIFMGRPPTELEPEDIQL